MDHYHYIYGEEETEFVLANNTVSNNTISNVNPYDKSYYFYGVITNVNAKYVMFESLVDSDYIQSGTEAIILLSNSPKITFNTESYNSKQLKEGQFIEGTAEKFIDGNDYIELVTDEIMVSEPSNSMSIK